MVLDNSENLKYSIASGVVGVGATLVCASALGIGVVSAPVILSAVGVGLGCMVVGGVVVRPVAEKLFSNETKNPSI